MEVIPVRNFRPRLRSKIFIYIQFLNPLLPHFVTNLEVSAGSETCTRDLSRVRLLGLPSATEASGHTHEVLEVIYRTPQAVLHAPLVLLGVVCPGHARYRQGGVLRAVVTW